LKEEGESCAGDAKGSGTWPVIAGIRGKEKCQRAKLHAGIKPTALCSVFDKENSIEFPLDSVHYLYIKSNPNPSFYPMLLYESLSSHMSIDKKIK